ncbi:MAG: CDP-alcohol phosphatidyltransferase family protein [Spirochaetota bacterium]
MMGNEILFSLAPVIFFNCLLLSTFIIFAFIHKKRPKDNSVPEFSHKTFVGSFLREYGYWGTIPFIWFFKKLRLTPNQLTSVAPFLALVSAYFYYKGEFANAGWILIASGILDFLDGRLARATNQISKEGAYLDSNLDRYSDGIIFGGLALYYRNDLFMLIISIFSIIGIQITSYAKARGELNGISTKIGLMQRTERFVLLWVVSIFHPFIMMILNRNGITKEYPMIFALILMAVLTNYTAIVRILFTFKEIRKQSGK